MLNYDMILSLATSLNYNLNFRKSNIVNFIVGIQKAGNKGICTGITWTLKKLGTGFAMIDLRDAYIYVTHRSQAQDVPLLCLPGHKYLYS